MPFSLEIPQCFTKLNLKDKLKLESSISAVKYDSCLRAQAMPSHSGQEENQNFSSLLLQQKLGLDFISFCSSNLFNLSSLIVSGYFP